MALLRRIISQLDLNKLQPKTAIMTHSMCTGSNLGDSPPVRQSLADWKPGTSKRAAPLSPSGTSKRATPLSPSGTSKRAAPQSQTGSSRRAAPQSQPEKPPSYRQSKSQQKQQPSITSLAKAAQAGHIQEAERALKSLMDMPKMKLGPGLCVLLLDMYVKAEQLPGARKALERLHSLHPQAMLQPSKVLAMAVLLMHHGRTQECMGLLQTEAERSAQFELSHASDESELAAAEEPSNERLQTLREHEEDDALEEPESDPQQQQSKANPYMTKLCFDLLSAAGAGGDTSTCHQLLELLLHHRYATASRGLFGPLVRSYIAKDDLEGALSSVETLVARYRLIPSKAELTHAFIKRQDTKSLQRLVELSTAVMGLENSSLDLAVCFLEAGDTDKAVELLQSTGTVPSAERLQYLCQHYVKRGELTSLQGLLRVTRVCCSTNDTSPIYGHLLAAYERLRRHEDAASVLAAMENDGLTRQQCLPTQAAAAAGAAAGRRFETEGKVEPEMRPSPRSAAYPKR